MSTNRPQRKWLGFDTDWRGLTRSESTAIGTRSRPACVAEAASSWESPSLRTLSNWQTRRLIKLYHVGRVIFFKRSDTEVALEKFAVIPVGDPRPRRRDRKTMSELNEAAKPNRL